MLPLQQKITLSGESREWMIDRSVIEDHVPWVRHHPERFDQEMSAMQTPALSTFLLAFADQEQTDIRLCSRCGDMMVCWDGAIRCVNCRYVSDLIYQKERIGCIGQVLTRIGVIDDDGETTGRPILQSVISRTLEMADSDPRKSLFHSYFLTIDNQIWFAPPIISFFPDSWPDQAPDIFVRREYFDVLNIQPAHVFEDLGTHLALIEYSDGSQPPLAAILENEIFPRIELDLMFADIQAIGRLEDLLRDLDGNGPPYGSDGVMQKAYVSDQNSSDGRLRALYQHYLRLAQEGVG